MFQLLALPGTNLSKPKFDKSSMTIIRRFNAMVHRKDNQVRVTSFQKHKALDYSLEGFRYDFASYLRRIVVRDYNLRGRGDRIHYEMKPSLNAEVRRHYRCLVNELKECKQGNLSLCLNTNHDSRSCSTWMKCRTF